MTSPGNAGEIFVDVHANTDPVDPELRAGLEKAARDAEKVMDSAGKNLGASLADSTAEELEKHGKEIGDAVDKGVRKHKINIDGEWFTVDRNGGLHNAAGRFAGRLGADMVGEVANAFQAATKAGGIFSKIGEAITDAIGAGFNVSGKSPLIVAMIPLMGAIVTAIVGAIQAVNGLSAALVAVPPLVAAIGLQVATVAIAFDGVGEAMSKAFDAKNAREFQEAVKGLTPAAQDFVKSMIPVRDMFNDLKKIIQESFFQGLDNSIAPMLRSLIEITKGPFAQLARTMGEFFAQLADFFDSKVFATFVTTIFPATARWLQSFGPVFVTLLEALTRMATVAIPFLEKLGALLNKVLLKVADKINQAVEDGSLQAWLDDMLETLKTLAGVFGSIIVFVKEFIGAIDKAGGNKALEKIGEFFGRLAFFFASPVGVKALEGIINTAIILTEVLGGLIIVVGVLFAGFQKAAEAIGAFLDWLWNTALPAVGKFFSDIWQAITDWWFKVKMWLTELRDGFFNTLTSIGKFFADLWNGAKEKFVDFIEWAKELPGKILRAIGDLGRLLWDAGVKIIKGLWDGMVEKFKEVRNWLANLAIEITQVKGPLDYDKIMLVPAGEAIMGGLEQGMRNKLGDVLSLASGITNTLAGIGTANFTPPDVDAMSLSATQVINMNMGGLNFDGAPTAEQAAAAGKAAAGGMMSQLQRRDTRVKVRMM